MKTLEQFKEEYIAKLETTDNLTKIDIIEQNMNAIDAGVEFAQRWHSVTEMMPENNELVLVAIYGCMDDIVCARHNSSGWICRLYIPTGHPDFIIEDKVTHWRPINIK